MAQVKVEIVFDTETPLVLQEAIKEYLQEDLAGFLEFGESVVSIKIVESE